MICSFSRRRRKVLEGKFLSAFSNPKFEYLRLLEETFMLLSYPEKTIKIKIVYNNVSLSNGKNRIEIIFWVSKTFLVWEKNDR